MLRQEALAMLPVPVLVPEVVLEHWEGFAVIRIMT